MNAVPALPAAQAAPNEPHAATVADYAAALGAKGFHVFPLAPGSKRPPKGVSWARRATRDPERIQNMFGAEDNIGIATGMFGDGHALLVVDVDGKPGHEGEGEASLRALEAEHRPLPETLRVNTPSGGYHLYYRVPQAVKQGVHVLGPSVDIRSSGGFVVAPGSTLVECEDHGAGTYTVENRDADIVDAPDWLVQRCGQPRGKDPDADKPLPGVNPDRARARAIEYLQTEAPEAIEGAGGDNTTYAVAARVKDFGVPRDECAALMLEHWFEGCGWTPAALQDKVDHAYKYGLDRPGSADPSAVFTGVPIDEPMPAAKPNGPTFHVRKASDLLTDPEPQWLVDGLLPDRGLGVIFGAPASGKSFLALDIAAAIARGVPWGARDVRKGKVVYVGLEGRQRSRVEAYLQHHKLKRDGLDNVLVIERQPLDLLAQKFEPAAALVRDVSAVAGSDVRAVFIDTLNRAMPGGDENSSQDMGQAITAAQAIADRLGCLVVIVHHSGKDTTQGARGHSSLHGAADVELEVSRKDDVRTVKLAKLKDGEDGHKWTCRLQSVSLGRTAKGKPRGSCVVAELATAEKRDAKQASPAERVVLMALQAATAAKRDDPTTPGDYFAEVIVTRDEWREAYFKSECVPADASARETKDAGGRFRTALGRLVEKGLVLDRGQNKYAIPVT